MTKFALERVNIADYEFWFDGNSKITAGDGNYAVPVANAFSLPHIASCPYATPVCMEHCYVGGLAKEEWNIYQAYLRNFREMERLLSETDGKDREAAAVAFGAHIKRFDYFRWHVSGDLFSEEYTEFVALASYSAATSQWIYTRSFEFLDILAPSGDYLIINLSADKNNYKMARLYHEKFGHRICYMTLDGKVPADLPTDSVIFWKHPARGLVRPDSLQRSPEWMSLTTAQKKMICPPDFFGQSEKLRCGPCRKCMV